MNDCGFDARAATRPRLTVEYVIAITLVITHATNSFTLERKGGGMNYSTEPQMYQGNQLNEIMEKITFRNKISDFKTKVSILKLFHASLIDNRDNNFSTIGQRYRHKNITDFLLFSKKKNT